VLAEAIKSQLTDGDVIIVILPVSSLLFRIISPKAVMDVNAHIRLRYNHPKFAYLHEGF
jgi:hypothetical protein